MPRLQASNLEPEMAHGRLFPAAVKAVADPGGRFGVATFVTAAVVVVAEVSRAANADTAVRSNVAAVKSDHFT